MVVLYINSHIVCGLFCSRPCVSTPNAYSDIWDCVESYRIQKFLTRRLKITFTSNLKLIISFLVLLIIVLLFKSRYHLLPQLGTLHLFLRVYLRLANRPSAQFANSSKQEWPSSSRTNLKRRGPVLPFFKSRKGISPTSLSRAHLEQETPSIFSYNLLSARNQKKSYQRATNEDKISTFSKRSAIFILQKTCHLNAIVTTRSTYNESREVCPRRT